MLAFTHVLFGILLGLLAKPYIPGDVVIYYTFVIIGSILPDIDHEGSTINKVIPLTKWFARLFTHRGIFHTVFPVIALFFVLGYFSTTLVALALVVGYVAHLISDGMTVMGVNLLHPISHFRIQGFIHTGGKAEVITCVVIGLLCLALIF